MFAGVVPLRARTVSHVIVRYGAAVLAVALVVWPTSFLAGYAPVGSFMLFYAAVAFAAWFGGRGPGLAATAVATLVADWLFVPPIGDLRLGDPRDWIPLVAFGATAIVVSALTERLRVAREAAEARAAELALRAREAEEATRRVSALQATTAALSRALTPREVADVVVSQGLEAVGARAGSVALVTADGQAVELLSTMGYAPEVVERFRRIPLDASFPLTDAVRDGVAIVLRDYAERDQRYPHLADVRRANGDGAMAAIPLVLDGRAVGVMGVNVRDGRVLSDGDVALLTALAQQCAQALERARLFEAEQQARSEAERANRSKMEFLATMSHELRTPLNAIGGYAELLEMGVRGPVTAEQREDLLRVQRSQRHLLSLINDLLNFAKIDAGRVEYRLASIPLHPVLAGLESLVAPQLRSRGHGYTCEPPSPDVLVWTDRDKLEQILLNLLTNAIKFTAPGGRITVSAEVLEHDALVRVADTGRGIPADHLDRIFEPFVQLDRGHTRTSEGTGLGLAISRDLARAMGGELSAESAIGRGSTFTLRLPRSTAAPAAAASALSAAGA